VVLDVVDWMKPGNVGKTWELTKPLQDINGQPCPGEVVFTVMAQLLEVRLSIIWQRVCSFIVGTFLQLKLVPLVQIVQFVQFLSAVAMALVLGDLAGSSQQ